MIPEGWREATAEELCSRISVGIVVKPTQYYVDKEQGVRAFRSANIGEGFIRDSDWIHISEDGHVKNKKSALKANDILIVRTGYPGTACLLPPEYEGSNCIDIIFARPDPEQVVPAYLCTYTNSEYGKKQVLDGSGGLAQQHFNVGAYKKLKLPLPPLFEQKSIAETLQTWDRAIETVEALIAGARAQKQALMQQLLPQGTTPPKKRLPGFSGEWRERTIKQFGKVESGGTPASGNPTYWGGDIAWVTPGEITKLRSRHLAGTERTITKEGLANSSAKLLPIGTVIVCTRATVGVLAIATTPMTTNQGFKNIVANQQHDSEFLYYLLTHNKKALLRAAAGSTFAEISKTDFEKLAFAVPELDEQRAITSMLIDADGMIERRSTQLTALHQEKSALMQQLLTGKRRVKVNESEDG